MQQPRDTYILCDPLPSALQLSIDLASINVTNHLARTRNDQYTSEILATPVEYFEVWSSSLDNDSPSDLPAPLQ